MGYYTNYTLSILNHDELEPDIDLKVAKALANLDYLRITMKSARRNFSQVLKIIIEKAEILLLK